MTDEQPREVAKRGDTIAVQLSVYSHNRILSVVLETQDSVDFANAELLNRGRWQIVQPKAEAKR